MLDTAVRTAKAPVKADFDQAACDRISERLDGAAGVIEMWLDCDSREQRAPDLDVKPAGVSFCEALRFILDPVDREFSDLAEREGEAFSKHQLRASILVCGACELLLQASIAEELAPSSGFAILQVLKSAQDLLIAASDEDFDRRGGTEASAAVAAS